MCQTRSLVGDTCVTIPSGSATSAWFQWLDWCKEMPRCYDTCSCIGVCLVLCFILMVIPVFYAMRPYKPRHGAHCTRRHDHRPWRCTYFYSPRRGKLYDKLGKQSASMFLFLVHDFNTKNQMRAYLGANVPLVSRTTTNSWARNNESNMHLDECQDYQ